MFPRGDPFDRNMDSYIRDLLSAGNPGFERSNQLTIDQHINDDKLTVTIDISEYKKEDVRLEAETVKDKSYLIINLTQRNEYGMKSFTNKIELKHTVDDSTAKATENNGVMTVEFDMVESESHFIDIE